MDKNNKNNNSNKKRHLEEQYDPRDNIKLVLGDAVESLGDIKYHIDEKGDAYDLNGNYIPLAATPEIVVTPSKESYIDQKIQEKRDKAVRNILSTEMPTAVKGNQIRKPYYNFLDSELNNYSSDYDKEQKDRYKQLCKENEMLGETCISTATTPYGETIAYNPTLANNPEKYGYKRIIEPYEGDINPNNTYHKINKLANATKPGDIMQFYGDSNGVFHPYHAVMNLGAINSPLFGTKILTKQSHGFYDKLDTKMYDASYYENLLSKAALYRYIGTPKERKILSDKFDLMKQKWNNNNK